MLEKRHLIGAWGILECLLFGGLIYGWGSLVFIMKEEQIYAELCDYNTSTTSSESQPTTLGPTKVLFSPNVSQLWNVTYNTSLLSNQTVNSTKDGETTSKSHQRCKPQDDRFNLVFTVASVMFCFGSAVLGQVHFMYGTRVTRCISMFLFILGSLLIGLTSVDAPWLIFIGLSTLGIGGLPILMTNTQISYLFEKSGMYVTSLSGCFDSSVVVMLVIKIVYQHGIPRPYSFYFLCGLHLVVGVSTFCFLPKGHIPKKVPSSEKELTNVKEELIDKENSFKNPEKSEENGEISSQPTLRECMKSSKYIFHVVWLSLLQLRFFYFMGTLNPWLSRFFEDDSDKVSSYTNSCFYMMMCGFIFAFVVGALYDSQTNHYSKHPVLAIRLLRPSVLPLLVTSSLAVLLSVSVLIPMEEFFYVSFLLLTMFRACMYGIYAAYLSILFPGEYFGILYGLGVVIGGVVSAVQYAFFSWSEAYDGALQHVNIVLLCISIASFIHPIFQFFSCRRIQRAAMTFR